MKFIKVIFVLATLLVVSCADMHHRDTQSSGRKDAPLMSHDH